WCQRQRGARQKLLPGRVKINLAAARSTSRARRARGCRNSPALLPARRAATQLPHRRAANDVARAAEKLLEGVKRIREYATSISREAGLSRRDRTACKI